MPPAAQPAECWKLRTRTLAFGRLPLLMGIVNVTPDSFSDGGRYFDRRAAVEHGLQLVADGADILDIGGESTRPGSLPVDQREEMRRVLPVIESLRRQTDVPLSIDTSKAAIARAAIDAGAEILNDITALSGDAAMLPTAVETGVGVCIMHMRGEPRTMQDEPHYADVVAEVLEYLRHRRDVLVAAGVEPSHIAVDPGIGFGKTTAHNLQLLAAAEQFHALGCPVLIGHSRKRFFVEVIGDSKCDRTAGVIGVALALARRRVQIIRIHDVAAVRQAQQLFQAAGGLDA
jgi:dihydropteroate synthase